MGKTKLCTFGQECENAVGYDDQHAEIILGDKKTLSKKNVDVKSLCISSSKDYKQFCALLNISPKLLLKMFSNGKTKMDKIWKCIFDINQFPCFCINIFIINDTVNVEKEKNNKFQHIKKFYGGHHVLVFIPFKQTITDSYDTHIRQIIQGENRVSIDFLEKATVLINYQEKMECESAYYFLYGLLDFLKSRQPIYCFMSVSLPIEILKDYSEETILTLLSIKKVLHIIKQKFPAEIDSIIDCMNQSMTVVERMNLGAAIIDEAAKLQSYLTENMPLLNTNRLYLMLRRYHDHFLKELYNGISVSHGNASLYQRLNQTSEDLFLTPFTKISGCWMLRMSDKNSCEISNLLPRKHWIILNDTTMNYLEQIYSKFNNYYFILSNAEKDVIYQEPMLQTPDEKRYEIGISTYQERPFEIVDATKDVMFQAACECGTIEKVWMCSICKSFLYKVKEDNEWLKCTCGIYKISNTSRKCFKCLTQEEMNNLKQNANNEVNEKPAIPNIQAVDEKDGVPNELPSIKTEIKEMPPPEFKNIIFVGQTGAGKSTLINGFANYTKYNFDEACTESLDCILPINFQMQDPKFQTVTIKAGPENANENFNDGGQSVTQKAQTYKIIAGDETINIIDTPGLGDSRGTKQDLLNIESIKEAITKCGKIDAICFVMPSNISKLTANFEMNMRDLLSLLPKTAVKNVYFFFTYANSSFFAIGNTRKPLEEFIANFKATKTAEIQFGAENVFLVDSEAFMYFIATEQKYVYQKRDQESFRMSWDKSKEAINKFLAKLKNFVPIKSSDIQMNYELENCIKNFAQNYPLPFEEDNIQSLLVLAYSATSMSSLSFGTHKKFTNEELKESVQSAAEYCQMLKEEDDLKEKLQKLLQYYYSSFFQNTNVNNTIPVVPPTSADLMAKLKDICKCLKEYRKNEETNVSDDVKFVNANLEIHDAVDDENFSPKLGFSLNFLLNYFKTKNNFEMEQKLENVLSLITATNLVKGDA